MVARVGFMVLWSVIMLLVYGGFRLVEWLFGLIGLLSVWGLGWLLNAGFLVTFWGLAIVWLIGLGFIAFRRDRGTTTV